MKLQKIFIALFGAFLLTSPQVMVTMGEFAGDLEKGVGEDAARAGEREGTEIAENEGEAASDAAKGQAGQAKALDQGTQDLTEQTTQAAEQVDEDAQKSVQASEAGVDAVEDERAALADEVKGKGAPGARSADASRGEPGKPENLTPEEREAKINNLKNTMESVKSVSEDLRSSAKDLSDIDPAAEKNANLTADQMKKKINKWIDDPAVSDTTKTELRESLKNAGFDKNSLFEEAKKAKKAIVDGRIDNLPDGELKTALKTGNENFFKKIESGKESSFSKMNSEEIDRFANDSINDTMQDARSKAYDYCKKELNTLGLKEGGGKWFTAERYIREGTSELKSLAEEGEQYGAGRNIKDTLARKVKALPEIVKGAFMHVVETLFSAVLFMVPNLIQSAITGGEQKKAEVLKWARPVEFGGKVYQIPDEFLHTESVNVLSQGAASYLTGSVPVYVQIPVSAVDKNISSDVSKMFNNAIADPNTDDNSKENNKKFYDANRYTIKDTSFYDMTDIVVSYGGVGSMTPTGGTILEGSEFGGQVISLKTGLVTDASGEVFNATGLELVDGISQAPAVPLIPVIAWGNLTVPQTSPINQGLQSSFEIQPTILEKLELLKLELSKDPSLEKVMIQLDKRMNLFDTSCLNSNGGLNTTSCSSMIVQGLEEIQSGLDIQADGTVSFAEMTLPSDSVSVIGATAGALTGLKQGTSSASSSAVTIAVATTATTPAKSQKKFTLGRLSDSSSASTSAATSSWSGLGAVIPVFGWGTDPKTNQSTTIIPTVKGSVFEGFAFTPLAAGYADDDAVWGAQGCWIYLCAQTPFIQKLQEKFPALTPSVAGSITDYIVFMDENFNIVPLMSPENIEEKDSTGTVIWKKATFTVNPVIRYWTSLVFYNDDYMVQEVSKQSQAAILFRISDTAATPLAESKLGIMESLITDQNPNNGTIPLFLQGAQNSPAPISQTFSRIYDQMQAHKLALRFKAQQAAMQFNINGKNANLALSSKYSIASKDDKGNPITFPVYSGAKCFGVSSPDDLLVALDENNSPLQLPSNDVASFVSLITDIIYQVDSSGNFVYSTNSQSPLKVDANNQPIKNGSLYEINGGLATNLTNLSQFVGASDGLTTTSSTKKYAANKDVIAYVQARRTAWLESIDNVVELGTGANTILCNLANGISSSFAQANNCFIYELNETPSILYTTSDYFVVVDKASPALSSLSSVKKLDPQSTSTVLVSLITGTLYNVVDGSAIQDQNGNPERIKIPSDKYFSKKDANTIKTTADIIYETVTTQYKGLSKDFKAAYKQLVDGYNTTQAIPKGPYAFGKHKVAIRSIDNSMGNYVYFNAADMTKVHVKPKNMYVILTKSGSGYQPDKYDKTKNQVLLSLITGIAVDKKGVFAGKQEKEKLDSIIAQYSSVPFIAQNIKRLQSEYEEKQAIIQEDIKKKDQDLKDLANNTNKLLKLDPKVAAVIKRLQPAGSGLAAPFAQLQQDPTTGDYVHISPTATSGELIYQFMDTGKVYDYSGRFVMQLSPGHLQTIRDQLGLVVDAKSGKQKLGIPQFQPSLRLINKDASVAVGQTGEDMIAVGSADYPDTTIKMSAGNGLFYNKSMDTYYVLDSKNNIWLSVDGGNVYQKNGQAIADDKTVATFISSKTGKVYPLLLESNSAGYMQGFLPDGSEYVNLSTSNKDMEWLGLSGDFNQYVVTTDAKSSKATPTSYKVQYAKNNTRTFTVNPDYSWQDLSLVPIDKNGQLLKTIPNSSYQRMQLVQKGTSLKFAIYNGTLYSVGKSSKGTVTLTPFNPKDLNAVVGLKLTTGLVDKGTNASYVEITDGANVYKYGYMPKIFSAAQQEANRVNIIKGVTAAAPISLPVGPMKDVTVKVGDKNITTKQPTIKTNVMFAADLPMKAANVNAAKATIKDIVNPVDVKANPKGYEQFIFDLQISGSGLGNGVMKTSDGRFIYKLAAKKYTYVLEDAYVDLKNGSLYDATTGMALGICLTLNDFISLLNTVGVVVNDKMVDGKAKDLNGQNMLQYRGVIKQASKANVAATNQTA